MKSLKTKQQKSKKPTEKKTRVRTKKSESSIEVPKEIIEEKSDIPVAVEDFENFYISASLNTIKLDEPLMLVFKGAKNNEISFEKDGFKIKIKVFSGKTNTEYSYSYKELESLFKNGKKG